ncbi:hypothetical protein QR680_012591 [Steinernema hermaphroditum]|uniref:DDT domain-containing protein n=1 Tax=Steinernema hermaphroditum TaxID=289476 RepID=A0AA39M102_9BILA|nr:hypothetical protein QR680_012591 [Steinernema hermaphroditum]
MVIEDRLLMAIQDATPIPATLSSNSKAFEHPFAVADIGHTLQENSQKSVEDASICLTSTRNTTQHCHGEYLNIGSTSSDEASHSDASDRLFVESDLELTDEEIDVGSIHGEHSEVDLSDGEDVPELVLPEGSDDIPLEHEFLLDAFEVYETCRIHYRLLMLSPFCIEDFIRALRTSEQSRLLAEIHMAFLKFVLRDDDKEQISLASQELNPSFSLLTALIEPMTYAEVLRQYVDSDTIRFPRNVLDILNYTNYPFCSAKERLIVLRFLCNRFFDSGIFRHSSRQELKYKRDDYCRQCFLARAAVRTAIYECSFCEAVYHSTCLEEIDGHLPSDPANWDCSVCETHKTTTGVSVSTLLPDQTNLRLEPLGEDRHSRVYWFAGRRIFVVNPRDQSVTYYSTLPQLFPLIRLIGDGQYERRLHKRLIEEFDRLVVEMRTTMDLTIARHRDVLQLKPDITNDIYLLLDNAIRMAQIYRSCNEDQPVKGSIPLVTEFRNACGIDDDGHLFDSFWIGGIAEEEIAGIASRSPQMEDTIRRRANGFRLGLIEHHFRNYVNQYSCNDYAKSPLLRNKERDRRKYLSGRFAIEDEFEWICPKGRDQFGPPFQTLKSLQWTLDELRKKIPRPLFHRLWGDYVDKFRTELDAANTIDKLKHMLLKMECAIRKPVFSNAWWNTLGHTTLCRYSVEDKDAKKREDSGRHRGAVKIQSSEEDVAVVSVKFRNGIQPKHVLWRVKGEEYRQHGKGQLGGWLWRSRCWRRTFVSGLPKVPCGITASLDPSDFKRNSPERRAYRLNQIVDKIVNQRIAGECSEDKPPKLRDEEAAFPAERLGMEIPFPLQEPFSYKSHTCGKTSILNLKPPILRRLARQGGLSNIFLHGFSRTAKPNPLFWNIPAPRPTFDNCWRYLTYNAKSLHAVALQMRIMIACIRWKDLQQETDESRHTIRGPDGVEQRTLIGHIEHPPDGYYEQYKVRIYKITDQHDARIDEGDDSEDYVEGRSRGVGKKAKRSSRVSSTYLTPKIAQTYDVWMDGVDLTLWEISNYWQGFSRGVGPQLPLNKPSPPVRKFQQVVAPPAQVVEQWSSVGATPKRVKLHIPPNAPAISASPSIFARPVNGTPLSGSQSLYSRPPENYAPNRQVLSQPPYVNQNVVTQLPTGFMSPVGRLGTAATGISIYRLIPNSRRI